MGKKGKKAMPAKGIKNAFTSNIPSIKLGGRKKSAEKALKTGKQATVNFKPGKKQ